MVGILVLSNILPPRQVVDGKFVHDRASVRSLDFRLDVEEGSGRLNNLDVLVKVSGERPLGCSRDGVAVTVLVVGVLCLEKLLGLLDGNDNRDPVLCRGVADVLDAVLRQPAVNLVDALCLRADDVGDLSSCEVLAITFVAWVGDLDQMALNKTLVALGQADLEVDGLSLVGRASCLPSTRDDMAFLDLVVVGGSGGQGVCAEQSSKSTQRDGEGDSCHCCLQMTLVRDAEVEMQQKYR